MRRLLSRRNILAGVVALLVVCMACVALSPRAPAPTQTASAPAVTVAPVSVPPTLAAAAPAATNTPLPAPTQPPAATPTTGPTRTPAPTQPPPATRTPAPPTATPSPQDALAKIGQDILGRSDYRRSELINLGDGYTATIEGHMSVLTEGLAVSAAALEFLQSAQRVFTDMPQVQIYQFVQTTELKDVYGKTSEAPVLKLTMTRRLAEKVEWKGLNFRDVDRLLKSDQGSGVYVHPALKKAWDDNQR